MVCKDEAKVKLLFIPKNFLTEKIYLVLSLKFSVFLLQYIYKNHNQNQEVPQACCKTTNTCD